MPKSEIEIQFPQLFKNAFDVSLPQGWEALVTKLCQDIEDVIRNLPEDEQETYKVAQVKEKFGGLRFYMDGGVNPVVRDLISNAEDESFKICDVCGKLGTLRYGNWIRTLCDEHEVERQEQIAKRDAEWEERKKLYQKP